MTEEELIQIENKWKDRFYDCKSPAPDGMEKIGYVVDIYKLLKHIRHNDPDTVTIKRSELENVKEIIRLNLVMYSRKDEVALLSAFKILETALGEKK